MLFSIMSNFFFLSLHMPDTRNLTPVCVSQIPSSEYCISYSVYTYYVSVISTQKPLNLPPPLLSYQKKIVEGTPSNISHHHNRTNRHTSHHLKTEKKRFFFLLHTTKMTANSKRKFLFFTIYFMLTITSCTW